MYMANDVKEIINNWFRNNAKIKDKRHKRTYIYTLGDNNIEVILNNQQSRYFMNLFDKFLFTLHNGITLDLYDIDHYTIDTTKGIFAGKDVLPYLQRLADYYNNIFDSLDKKLQGYNPTIDKKGVYHFTQNGKEYTLEHCFYGSRGFELRHRYYCKSCNCNNLAKLSIPNFIKYCTQNSDIADKIDKVSHIFNERSEIISKQAHKFTSDLTTRVIRDANGRLKLLKDDLLNLRDIIDDYVTEIDTIIQDYGQK